MNTSEFIMLCLSALQLSRNTSYQGSAGSHTLTDDVVCFGI